MGERPAHTLAYVTPLADVFKHHGMHSHLQHLRDFWRQREAPVRSGWNADFVEHWLQMLRLPPFEFYFDVRARNVDCDRCPPLQSSTFTKTNFPGGWLTGCKCGREWLTLEGP